MKTLRDIIKSRRNVKLPSPSGARKPIVPDWTLSKAVYSRWKKIHPKSIENYTPMDKDGEMWTGNIHPDNEYLKLRREQLK